MIAGIGFARMAWELAHARRGYKPVTGIDYEPNPRASPYFPCHKQACLDCEYYRIIDSAEASWLAFSDERSIGFCPRVDL